jgi:DNA-binding NarL/FixJ family response regulator
MQQMENINIAVVDDQNLFRQSLGLLVSHVEHFQLAAECAGGQQFLDVLEQDAPQIDVALIDVDMPGINGIELNKIIQQRYPNIKVIILTVHVNEMLIARAINAGASSYLAKNCDKDELILAINTVHKTGFYFNSDALAAIRNGANHKAQAQELLSSLPLPLSVREQQILQLICKEYSNAEIAQELFLSQRTVEGHRTNLLNKVNCRNTAGLVLFAVKSQLFQLQD